MNIIDSIKTRIDALDGWVACPKAGGAVALKMYDTAVGPRQAQAYVQDWGNGVFVLSGEYYSEGDNVLSTIWIRISTESSGAALDAAVAEFAKAVDERVAKTYAVRLLSLSA